MNFKDIVEAHEADTLGGFSKERMDIQVMHEHRSALIELAREMKPYVKFYKEEMEDSYQTAPANTPDDHRQWLKDEKKKAQALLDRLEKDNA